MVSNRDAYNQNETEADTNRESVANCGGDLLAKGVGRVYGWNLREFHLELGKKCDEGDSKVIHILNMSSSGNESWRQRIWACQALSESHFLPQKQTLMKQYVSQDESMGFMKPVTSPGSSRLTFFRI